MINIAEKIVRNSFASKTDKAGEPYSEHCFRVASAVEKECPHNESLKCIALMHDLLEDCKEWTKPALLSLFDEYVVEVIDILTLKPGQKYEDYIDLVSKDDYARIVKICDLRDNMDITRLNELTDKDFERLRKYHKAYHKLCKTKP